MILSSTYKIRNKFPSQPDYWHNFTDRNFAHPVSGFLDQECLTEHRFNCQLKLLPKDAIIYYFEF